VTERDDVFRRAVEAASKEGRLVGNCLEIAWQGYLLLKGRSPRTIIQAGSASWPRVPPELDDGVMNTHFSYVWDPDSYAARLALAGVFQAARLGGRKGFSLPEMHVWLARPDTRDIIDFTTGLWPEACKLTIGEEWLAPPPPDYLWADELPEGVHYAADRSAIDCVIHVLRLQGRKYP
jgi:hypothetical protein